MKVHTSNYRIEGYTTTPTETELGNLATGLGIPFMIDLGSGNLLNFDAFNLPKEPTVADAISHGADLVTFSGDLITCVKSLLTIESLPPSCRLPSIR